MFNICIGRIALIIGSFKENGLLRRKMVKVRRYCKDNYMKYQTFCVKFIFYETILTENVVILNYNS